MTQGEQSNVKIQVMSRYKVFTSTKVQILTQNALNSLALPVQQYKYARKMRYKFGLAIENTREPDYITEKLLTYADVC